MTARAAGLDSNRKVVVVLGMHRSGTSLLASVVRALGVDFGAELVPADRHNPAGYFEHDDIVRIHRQLVDSLDRQWTGPKGTLPYPDRFWESQAGKAAAGELRTVVEAEIRRAPTVWGFKDPRTSRLLPLWKTIFTDLNVRPIYLLAVRNPASVEGSVTERDGISSARAQLLWLLHNLAAVRGMWGEAAAVFDYDHWFSEPKVQARRLQQFLAVAASVEPAEPDGALDRLIQPGLRHNHEALREAIPFINEAYAGLLESAASGALPAKLLEIDLEVSRAFELLRAWSEVVNDLPAQLANPTDEPRRLRLALWGSHRSHSRG